MFDAQYIPLVLIAIAIFLLLTVLTGFICNNKLNHIHKLVNSKMTQVQYDLGEAKREISRLQAIIVEYSRHKG